MEVCPLNFDLTACLQDVVGFFRPFQNWSHRKKKKSQLETGGWGTIHHISLFDAAPENSNLFVMPKMYGLLRNGHIMPHWRGNVGKYYPPIWDGWDTSLKSMCAVKLDHLPLQHLPTVRPQFGNLFHQFTSESPNKLAQFYTKRNGKNLGIGFCKVESDHQKTH